MNIKKILKIGKCKNCQSGKFGKCCMSRKKAGAFVERNGKTKYFCNFGCAMLYLKLDEKAINEVSEKFWNIEGHYEQMASMVE